MISILSNRIFILALYVLLAVIASLQAINGGPKKFDGYEQTYTQYNNYIIFKNSFEHLKSNQDLYIHYPEKQWDLYKYTPTFSAFFGIFAVFPDSLGLFLWNLINVILIFYGIYLLPKLTQPQKAFACLILIFELLTSIQNEQSNGMMAGLMVLTFVFLERKQLFWATFCIVFSFYIKFFSIVGIILFLFYPNKLRAVAYFIFWLSILFLAPFIFIDWEQYEFLLKSYFNMLSEDHSASYGYSVMGWLHTWFGISINKFVVVVIGGLMLISPLWKFKLYRNYDYKFLMLISVLIWVVIFNHKAESPTFIIAMLGVTLWFIWTTNNTFTKILFLFAFVFTSLSPTDLFPSYVNENLVKPYTLKAVPCILIWFYILYQQWKMTLEKRIS